MSLLLRHILPSDNEFIAEIVRSSMMEFGADPKTTVLGDPTLNTMYENYQAPGAVYFIAEKDQQVLGGCGLRHLDGSEKNICELQRMFLLKEARGTGLGKILMNKCIDEARRFGYSQMYIESLSNMHQAIRLYEKSGFKHIPSALGNTGHGGCNVFMILDL